ncbi:MAG TPA: hypothetical protein DDZ51_20555 [Planctomycetaceae bacterium]|nr:hypothetical protein [Planctomycetaceae bacterium]
MAVAGAIDKTRTQDNRWQFHVLDVSLQNDFCFRLRLAVVSLHFDRLRFVGAEVISRRIAPSRADLAPAIEFSDALNNGQHLFQCDNIDLAKQIGWAPVADLCRYVHSDVDVRK